MPGARFAEIPVDAIVPNPKQPRQVFDEEALEELKTSIQEVGFLQPIVVRELGDEKYELVMGERRWRAAQALGPGDHPGDRPGHPRRRDAPRRAAGEHPPGQPEPAGRGGRVPAAAGGVRRHPRGAGPPDRPEPAADLQHDPAAEPARAGAAPGRRRRAVGRARPGAARPGRRRGSRSSWRTRIVAEGLSVRATEEIVALALADGRRRRRPRRKRRPKPHAPGARPIWPTGSPTGSTPG